MRRRGDLATAQERDQLTRRHANSDLGPAFPWNVVPQLLVPCALFAGTKAYP